MTDIGMPFSELNKYHTVSPRWRKSNYKLHVATSNIEKKRDIHVHVQMYALR